MSKRIYSVKKEKSEEFPLLDGSAWYKEVSDQEFRTLVDNGQIRHASGRFFATADFTEAREAAKGLASTDYSYEEPKEPVVQHSGESFNFSLYSNPGKTLKSIASLICIIGMIATVILAFTFGYTTDYWGYREFSFGAFLGILIIGAITSYLSGLGLAAFGDLVLSAKEINKKLK